MKDTLIGYPSRSGLVRPVPPWTGVTKELEVNDPVIKFLTLIARWMAKTLSSSGLILMLRDGGKE